MAPGHTPAEAAVDAYRRLLWGSMALLGVDDSIERKVVAAVTIQYASAMSILLLPVAFRGPRGWLATISPGLAVATAAVVGVATLAFVNTVWIVRRDLLDPIYELEAAATALAAGRLDAAPGDPATSDEVGTLQRAVSRLHRYVQVITAQAHALERGTFDAPVLERSVPGPLGESLDAMHAALERRARSRNRELEANERALRAFHRISADTNLDFTDKLEGLLAVGRERLGADYGYVATIDVDAGVLEVIAACGDGEALEPGDTVPLEQSYCRRTIGSDEPAYFERPEQWADDPAHEVVDFGSYIGRAIVVEESLYGAFCFGNEDPRPFSDLERTFVDLLALWASHEREHEKRITDLRILFDHSPDGILVHDFEGNIENVNDRIGEWLGFDRETLLGMNVTEFDLDHEPRDVAARLAATEAGEVTRIESVHRRADGSPFPVEIWINRIETDTETKFLSVVRDVSERRDRVKQLAVLDRVLRHNIRNELAIVRGYAQVLEDGPAAGEYAAEIVRACDQLLETVAKQRKIVTLLSNRPDPIEVDLPEAVRSPVSEAREQFPDARIECSLPDRLFVRAVPQLDQAIAELVTNALTHADGDRFVSISVSEGDRIPEESIAVEVADAGPGIPEEEVGVLTRERDIEPLFHGSGLGLWLIHWIVELSGGVVSFAENDPTGSVITIELPITDRSPRER